MQHPKLALVCSSGGHLFQLFTLKEWWGQFERVWVTFDKVDARSMLAKEKCFRAFHPTNRNIINLIRNTVVALKVLITEKPDIIISSGAAVAVPFFYLGKLLGKKLVFLEVFDRIDQPTLTGKLVYPITDVFLVQWEEQKAFFPKAEFWGRAL